MHSNNLKKLLKTYTVSFDKAYSTSYDANTTGNDNTKILCQKVRELKSSEIGKTIPKDCYVRSTYLYFWWRFFAVFVLIIGLLFISVYTDIVTKFFGGIICSIAIALMFIWVHDACS